MNSTTAETSSLSKTDRAIIPIAGHAARGDIEKLSVSLVDGLDSGLTVNEIKSVLVQMYAYCGFPRSLNALGSFMGLLETRRANGIEDTEGEAVHRQTIDSLRVGSENQTKLVGKEVSGPLFEFAPEIDEYLKSHLFGDIFSKAQLTWRQRELATIAALANMKFVESQLQAHFYISLNNGVTPSQLHEFISVLEQQCGAEFADNANRVLSQVLS